MTLLRKATRNYPTFPSLLDRFWEGDLMDWANANFSTTDTTLPAVNVKETNDEYEIELAAPGMKKEDSWNI